MNTDNPISKTDTKTYLSLFNPKSFFLGCFVTIVICATFLMFLKIQNDKEQAIEKEKKLKYERERAIIVRDSTERANKKVAEYYQMINFMQQYDSAKASMRHKIGDIVYLKPDSMRGVITDITVDNRLLTHTYFIMLSNAEQKTIERKEQLLY